MIQYVKRDCLPADIIQDGKAAKEGTDMRRLTCVLCILLCFLLPAPALSEWTSSQWAAVRAALAGDAAEPVPSELRIASSAPLPQGEEDRGLTVLLFGCDAPDISRNFGRADLMLLCRVDFLTGDIRLLSLPEEAAVQLPGLPGEIMLRHVNCFGGPLLLLQTVNQYLNAGAGRYCAVNFDTFRQVVDALGGVPMTLTAGEAQALDLAEGEQWLTGQDALRYVRLRRQGDGSARARKLMEAIALRFTSQASMREVYRLMDLLLPLLDTNLTTKNLVDAAANTAGRQEPGSFSAESLPFDGALDDEARQALRTFLYGEVSP